MDREQAQRLFEENHANAISLIKEFGLVADPGEETSLAVTLVMFGTALKERFPYGGQTPSELVQFALEYTGE